MLWTAPTTGIAMCPSPTNFAESGESVHGYKRPSAERPKTQPLRDPAFARRGSGLATSRPLALAAAPLCCYGPPRSDHGRGGSRVKAPNSVLSGYGTTVFEVMSRLAMEHPAMAHRAINPGQGFADADARLASARPPPRPSSEARTSSRVVRLARRALRDAPRARDQLRSGRVSLMVVGIES